MNPPRPSGQPAYNPTSLDFINRPNPVEPHAGPDKHPLHGAPRLETTKEEFIRLLIAENNVPSSNERPAKKQKSADPKTLDLPKLPTVKNGAKRLRIPPTLSGLHQPPPNARLLPSISEDQLVPLPEIKAGGAQSNGRERVVNVALDGEPVDKQNLEVAASESSPASRKIKRRKWTDEETSFLLQGVKEFGIGSWTRILNCPDYSFNERTAIDLKDRFRVCCPKENRVHRRDKKVISTEDENASYEPRRRRKGRPEFKKASAKFEELGMKDSFHKAQRRPRTAWSKAEDEALLQGFERHGNSWSSIQEDLALNLHSRKPTDLRDRFRTRYPEEYRKAGHTPRPEAFPKKPERHKPSAPDTHSKKQEQNDVPQHEPSHPQTRPIELQQREKETKDPSSSQSAKPKPAPATTVFHYHDVFFGAPSAEEDEDFPRPTLDRAILDESFDHPKHSSSTGATSLDTQDAASSSRNLGAYTSGPTVIPGLVSMLGGTLPSVAAITSGGDDFGEQLELPGLIGVFGSLEDEARVGGHGNGLEYLLG